MSNLFFRIYLVVFALITQFALAQEYPGDVSDGTLKVNGIGIPVKIYSTTEIIPLSAFPEKTTDSNVLVILNDSNLEPAHFDSSALIIAKYKTFRYQFFDKNFKLIDSPLTQDNITAFKYAVKSAKPITESDHIAL